MTGQIHPSVQRVLIKNYFSVYIGEWHCMLQVEGHFSRPEELRGWQGSPRERARRCAEPWRAPRPSPAQHPRPQPPRHRSPSCGGCGQLSARHRKPPLERHRPRSMHSTSAAHQPSPSPCTQSIPSRLLPPRHGEQRCTGGARSRRPAGWLPVGGKDGAGGRRAIRMSPWLRSRTRPGDLGTRVLPEARPGPGGARRRGPGPLPGNRRPRGAGGAGGAGRSEDARRGAGPRRAPVPVPLDVLLVPPLSPLGSARVPVSKRGEIIT